MEHLISIRCEHERRARHWTCALRLTQLALVGYALLLVLYLVTPFTGPFETVFGSYAFSIWLSIGVCSITALVMSTAHLQAHQHRNIAKHASDEISQLEGRLAKAQACVALERALASVEPLIGSQALDDSAPAKSI